MTHTTRLQDQYRLIFKEWGNTYWFLKSMAERFFVFSTLIKVSHMRPPLRECR
jgi:hypothetical protein